MKTGRLRIKENPFSSKSRTKSTHDLIDPRLILKHSTDLPPINPDFCLSRATILEQDKQKRISSYANHTISSDVSHILDTVSLKFSPRTSTVFNESLFNHPGEVKHLPNGRIELEHLKDWLDKMKEMYLPELDFIMNKKLAPKIDVVKKVEDIYLNALKELVKQVSVQSKARGEIMESVIDTLKYVWTKYPEQLLFDLEKRGQDYSQKMIQTRQKYKEKIFTLEESLSHLKKDLEKTETQNQELIRTVQYQENLISYHEACLKELTELRSKRFHSKEVSTQTMIDLKGDLERSFLKVRSLKLLQQSNPLPSIEESNELKIVLNSENNESDDRNLFMTHKDNFFNEIQKLTQNFELPEFIDVNQIQETLINKTENIESIEDWLMGFKHGLDLSNKARSETSVTTLTTQATLPSPCLHKEDKASRLRPQMPQRKSQSGKSATGEIDELASRQLIKDLVMRPEERLKKYAKNTNKKILKHINQVLYFAFGKKINKCTGLDNLVLLHFMNKYNVKTIARRKLKELVVGCLFNHCESIRMKLFLCAVGAGSYFNLNNFSTEGTTIMLRLYEFMITNKIGFILDPSDPLDIHNYPLSRAFECTRQIIGHYVSGDKLLNLLNSIKKLGENDPSHVNKEGIINLDAFIEIAVLTFEDYLNDIDSGFKVAIDSITEYNYLNKREIMVMFKHMASKKISMIKLINYDESHVINVEDFRSFCIEHGIFSLSSVNGFFENCEKDSKKVIEAVSQYEAEIETFFDSVKEETLKLKEWRWKFQYIILNLKSRKSLKPLHIFHLLQAEYLQIKKSIKSSD